MDQVPDRLIHGDALKCAAQAYADASRAKIYREQGGFFGIFDKWFAQIFARCMKFESALPWEASVLAEIRATPAEAGGLAWDFSRLRQFLHRWREGRLVEFAQREVSGAQYDPRFGTEFGGDVFLTAQGAPALMQWRGIPLLKTVFDFAMYPLLLAELRPKTVFEIGSGPGASAIWLADHLAILGVDAHVHSADINPPAQAHPGVTFHRGDCAIPESLFDTDLLLTAARPWLVIEDAHHNVAAVLAHFDRFLAPGDYLLVEDSEIKRDVLRRFTAGRPAVYKVDTRYTDYFGRNATCAADSIFVRTQN